MAKLAALALERESAPVAAPTVVAPTVAPPVAAPTVVAPTVAPPPVAAPAFERDDHENAGLGRFTRARRRQLQARKAHWRTIILHPQRIFGAMRALTQTNGGEEALGRFLKLLELRKWHPTDLCALRRFVAFSFGRDCAKGYNWGPRGKRGGSSSGTRAAMSLSRTASARKYSWSRLGTLGEALGTKTFGLSLRGVGQAFFAQLMAAGDDLPVDRSTVQEVFADLEFVGLCSVHQPPPGAKLAPFERNGKYAFNQYWFALAGQQRKPAMRGWLDDIVDWGARLVLGARHASLNHDPVPF